MDDVVGQQVDRSSEDPGDRLLRLFDVLALQFDDAEFHGNASVNAVAEVGGELPRVLEQAQVHMAQLRRYVAGLADAAGVSAPGAMARTLVLLIEGAVVDAQRNRSSEAAVAARQVAERLLADERRTA